MVFRNSNAHLFAPIKLRNSNMVSPSLKYTIYVFLRLDSFASKPHSRIKTQSSSAFISFASLNSRWFSFSGEFTLAHLKNTPRRKAPRQSPHLNMLLSIIALLSRNTPAYSRAFLQHFFSPFIFSRADFTSLVKVVFSFIAPCFLRFYRLCVFRSQA